MAENAANRVIAPVAFANFAIPNAIMDIGTSKGGIQLGKRIVTSIETYADNENYKIVNFAGDPVNVTTECFLSIHGLANVADEQIGSASGYIGTNGKANAYYRGRVAHANLWRYVLGAYRQTGTGEIWVAHDRDEADAYDALNTTVHVNTGLALPETSNYIQELHFLANFPLAPFAKTVGGNSTNPVGDYLYVPALTTGNTILICGAPASNGASCGRFYGAWHYTAGGSNWYCAALPFLK